MEKISRNQENFIIMTVIYDELNDFTAGKGQHFRDVNEIILEIKNDNPVVNIINSNTLNCNNNKLLFKNWRV